MLDRQILLHAPLGLEQPRRPGPRDRLGLLAALLIKLMASLALPATSRLLVADHRCPIQLQRSARRFRAIVHQPINLGGSFCETALGLAQRLPSSLRGLELLG